MARRPVRQRKAQMVRDEEEEEDMDMYATQQAEQQEPPEEWRSALRPAKARKQGAGQAPGGDGDQDSVLMAAMFRELMENMREGGLSEKVAGALGQLSPDASMLLSKLGYK